MSADAQLDLVPPLVIGVSGRMEFADSTTRLQVKDAVAKFLWRFVEADPTSPHVHTDWEPMPHTPVAVLTSLAPGADWLLAEVVDDLEKRFQALPAERKKRPWGFKVFAPLPFPAEQYAEATTYTGERGKADQTAAKARMLELAKTGHAFFVPLKADFEECDKLPAMTNPNLTQSQANAAREECLRARVRADLGVEGRRHLRYRAAGEYIAAHSHLMLILNDKAGVPATTPDAVTLPLVAELDHGPVDAGSAQVLRAKRQGITPNLLRSEVAFTWADSGPVIHFHTPATPSADTGKMTVLYPVDTRDDEGEVANDDPDWQWAAGLRFGEVLAQAEAFNVRMAAAGPTPEVGALPPVVPLPAGCFDGTRGLVPAEYARGLARLDRARGRADALAGQETDKWKKFVFWLFALTLLAALLLHLGLHWHTHAAHPEATHAKADDTHHPPDPSHADHPPPPADHPDPATAEAWEKGISVGWVALAAGLIAFAYFYFFRRFKREKREEKRFDFRAVAEGLKVQTYWAAAGLSQSVPANYMQRQRNEMVWIRRAITALAAPYTRWADGFAALGEKEQLAVLSAVVTGWVRWDRSRAPAADEEAANRSAQAGWMERAAYEEHRSERFWKRFGVTLTVTGIFNILFWLVARVFPGVLTTPCCDNWAFAAAWVVVGLLVLLWLGASVWAFRRKRTGGHHHGFPLPNSWRGNGLLAACQGGFVWVWEIIHPHDWVWEIKRRDRHHDKVQREWRYYLYRCVNVVVLAVIGTLVSFPLCHWLGERADWIPDPLVWWSFLIGALLVGGALAFTWPERHLMAEHARQYESMWAMYQAAGRRLLGHLTAAEEALKVNDHHLFRERVKAIQELLYQVGLQALDENAEWLILHRSRPLEPLMAG